MLFLLFGLVLVALGCWIYGRWCLPHKPARTRRLALVLALGAAVGGLAWGWPQVEPGVVEAGSHSEGGLTWEAWSPEKVAALRSEKAALERWGDHRNQGVVHHPIAEGGGAHQAWFGLAHLELPVGTWGVSKAL